jgi:hypothetical protein
VYCVGSEEREDFGSEGIQFRILRSFVLEISIMFTIFEK